MIDAPPASEEGWNWGGHTILAVGSLEAGNRDLMEGVWWYVGLGVWSGNWGKLCEFSEVRNVSGVRSAFRRVAESDGKVVPKGHVIGTFPL